MADVDALVETYRSAAVEVTYDRFRVGGHLAGAFAGLPGSLRFLRDRFASAGAHPPG